MRYLIVNADDLGLTDGVNRGILEAAEHGIVTSASLMVRQPAAAGAARACKGSALSIGLHLDLGEWVFRNGEWVLAYSVVDTNDPQAVAAEVGRQLAEFRKLLGRNPTHLDSHQHAHRNEPVRSIALKHARDLGIALRECTPEIRYCGDFYGQTGEGEPLPGALTVGGLGAILAALTPGITELGCHPGYADGLDSVYRLEREQELQVLCAPELRPLLKRLGIELRSFG